MPNAVTVLSIMQVIQAVAATLDIPIEFVKVKPTNTLTGANNQGTGGSVGSELNVIVRKHSELIII